MNTKKRRASKKESRVKNVVTKTVKKDTPRKEKPVGVITHYYRKIGVAIIKCKTMLSVGDIIHIQGATTNFSQNIDSMQFNHKNILRTKKGQVIGIKSKKRVREGDEVFGVA